MNAKMVEMMDELTTPERQRDSGTGANDGYTDLEMIEKDNETLRELVRELEAKLSNGKHFINLKCSANAITTTPQLRTRITLSLN